MHGGRWLIIRIDVEMKLIDSRKTRNGNRVDISRYTSMIWSGPRGIAYDADLILMNLPNTTIAGDV